MIRTFLHGGSVSRDVLAALHGHGFELSHHTSGQSLISVRGAIPGLEERADMSRLGSRSQRRALVGTLRCDLLERLETHRAVSDLLVWDLADEVLGVFEHEGGIVTRTPELMVSGLDGVLARNTRHMAFGTDRHFDLWTRSVATWAQAIETYGLAERVLLLAPPWATAAEDGRPITSYAGIPAPTYAAAVPYYIERALQALPSLVVIGHDHTMTAAQGPDKPVPFRYSAASNHRLAVDLHNAAYGTASSLPPPFPRVERTDSRNFFIHASPTWADEFALYVMRAKEVVERIQYRTSPEFHVTIDEPGTYRFRVFHKQAERRTAVYSEPHKVV